MKESFLHYFLRVKSFLIITKLSSHERIYWYTVYIKLIYAVQFSCSVVSNSLQPHEPQHTRLPRPSPTPGVYSNPWPPSWRCHPTIPSSATPFSFCPQSFPASRSFLMSWHSFRGGETGVPCSPQISVLLGVSGLPQGNPHPRSGTAA